MYTTCFFKLEQKPDVLCKAYAKGGWFAYLFSGLEAISFLFKVGVARYHFFRTDTNIYIRPIPISILYSAVFFFNQCRISIPQCVLN